MCGDAAVLKGRIVGRGILSGIFWGLVISFVAVAMTSLNSDLPGDAPPSTGAAEVPAGSGFNQSREDAPAVLPGGQDVAKAPGAQGPAAPEPDDLAPIDPVGTMPAARPETGGPETSLASAPAEGAPAPEMEMATDDPVQPTAPAVAPDAPEAEDEPALATAPAPAPEMAQADAGDPAVVAPDADTPGFPSGDLQAAAESPVIAPVNEPGENLPQEAEADSPPRVDTAIAPAPGLPAPGELAPVAGASDVPAPAPQMIQPEAPESEPEPEVAEAPSLPEVAQPDAPASETADAGTGAETTAGSDQVAAAPPPATQRPGQPAGTLTDRSGARSGRLPSVGDTPQQDTADLPEEIDTADSDLPPLQRYAAPFDNPENKPMMAIVLIDDGSSAIGLGQLAAFPDALTIAIDPAWSGAAEAMAEYRAAGFDVMILGDMADTASARDMETSFEVWASRLPEAVGLMEGDGAGLQGSRAVAEQLADILGQQGYGLVLYPNGLDTARKLATRKGVPAATVFRDFDSDGQSADVIRRFLDHAAFRAGQEGGVVMVGRLRAETVQALLVWSLQDRASRVALAPISALLTEGAGG